jgi:hypothetical protein
LQAPTAEDVARIAATARAGRVAFRRNDLDALIACLEESELDPERLASAEDVAALWLLLLDRRQVPPGVMEKHAGRTSLRDLRRTILRMPEFRRRNGV